MKNKNNSKRNKKATPSGDPEGVVTLEEEGTSRP